MSTIINQIWKPSKDKSNKSKMQIAFVISVCEILLNPENLIITISEEIIKETLNKNIVSF